jgi:uncharacterized protein YjbI with pentapeptide repeats
LGDLQEQADATEKAGLEQQRLEQARLEQLRIRTQWQEWQQRMQKDYDKVTAFEQQAIENQLKVESWERFLSSWKNDNPYSERDKELRSKAQTRIIYWQKKGQQAVKQQKKPVEVVLSGEDALEKLRATNSCENCDLQGANLNGADLTEASLQGANLERATLRFTKLKGATFCNTTMRDGSINNDDC